MQAGFGMVEAGCVSKKNNVNIMMKNMADMVVGGLSFYFIGYPIAFTLLSWQWEFEPQDSAHWFFQFSFAATASTIDSGAVAERISFGPYIVISALTAGFIYPMCAWAVWNEDGFLYQLGFVDFAGGAAIHALGGMGALVLIFILGPRIGRFKDYKPSQRRLFQPLCQRPADPLYYQASSSVPKVTKMPQATLCLFGTLLLVFGWFGFNPGSVAAISGENVYLVGIVTVNTTMGALGGGLAGLTWSLLFSSTRKAQPEDISCGVLSGLVAVTAGCLWFKTFDSFIVAVTGGYICFVCKMMLEYSRLDDVVGAIPVHMAAGNWGALAIGLFAIQNQCGGRDLVGLFYAKGKDQTTAAWELFGAQLAGVLVINLWAAVTTGGLAILLNYTGFHLRASRKDELLGLDVTEHDTEEHDVLDHILRGLIMNLGSVEWRDKDAKDNLDILYRAFNKAKVRLNYSKFSNPLPKDGNKYMMEIAQEQNLDVVGVLNVTICKLYGLSPVDPTKRFDLYVHIELVDGTPLAAHFQPLLQSLGSHYSKKTRVKRKSLNPEWSESIDFAIRDHFDYSRLHAWFRLMCVAVTGKSIALAEGQLPLADLLSGDISMPTHRNSLRNDDSSASAAGAGESESVAMSPSKPGLVRGRPSIEKKETRIQVELSEPQVREMRKGSVASIQDAADPLSSPKDLLRDFNTRRALDASGSRNKLILFKKGSWVKKHSKMFSEDDEREARSPSQDITNVINTTALDAAAALAQTQPETSMLEAPASAVLHDAALCLRPAHLKGDNAAVDDEEDDRPTQEIPGGQKEEPGQLQPQDAVSETTEMAKQKGRVDFDMNEDAERGPRAYGSAAASRRDSVNSSITGRRHEFFCLEVDVCYTPVDARPKRMSELRCLMQEKESAARDMRDLRNKYVRRRRGSSSDASSGSRISDDHADTDEAGDGEHEGRVFAWARRLKEAFNHAAAHHHDVVSPRLEPRSVSAGVPGSRRLSLMGAVVNNVGRLSRRSSEAFKTGSSNMGGHRHRASVISEPDGGGPHRRPSLTDALAKFFTPKRASSYVPSSHQHNHPSQPVGDHSAPHDGDGPSSPPSFAPGQMETETQTPTRQPHHPHTVT
ncbi:unnamed protein product [Vitrella brassicaformis CCMP3155]|uniref:C2 domain-containing protein n=1 Tax=Vitrella brassicaformis (strain CCMP3155) TaxID=1169540 RepID=A0A0G4EVQ0_VITBC|nr:unnamed protein product [Vitrella brassicaformis CCMP3155]|eukprot:CEM02171.1 unnamed protein product [Vitrella brassicaformis CCMP3155]